MHRNTRIPSHPDSPINDPSASPSRAIAPPVRRNLFSAHLSRRPASSQEQPDSQSPTRPTSHHTSQPQHPSPRQPFPLPRAVSQNSPFASPPPLHPSFNIGDYDPNISPNHPISPGTNAQFFGGGGVVAVHPVTGRPLLPTLPTLPSRLRLSDDEDEGEGDEEDEDDDDDGDLDGEEHEDVMQGGHDPFGPKKGHGQTGTAAGFGAATAAANAASFASDPAEDEADIARYERERFDSVVGDLMTRYRSRRQHVQGQIHSHSLSAIGGGTQGQDGGTLRGKQKSTSTANTARSRQVQGEQAEDAETQAQEEKEELMSHLMAKLRSEVARAEEEGWMYGDASANTDGEGMDEVYGGGGYGGGYGGVGGAQGVQGAGVGGGGNVGVPNALGGGGGGGAGGRGGAGREEVVAFE